MWSRIRQGRAVLAFLATFPLFAASTGQTANDVDHESLRAARALIGATVKTAEFETMLRQVVKEFAAEVLKRAEGTDDRAVVRALMEQAGITIAQNRGVYLEGIAHIFARHLDARELRAAATFFSSPEGRRYAEVQDALTKDTIKYAVTMGGKLKSQIVSQTIKSLEQRGYKAKQD